jgi:hypothetical protein
MTQRCYLGEIISSLTTEEAGAERAAVALGNA